MADINLSYLTLIPITLLIFLKLITRPRATSIPIKSRHVFITGGSSGIGLALAKHSASEGARVTILARDLHKLQEAKTSIRLSTGIDVGVISADVTDYEAVKEAVESVGPIDVLICNQGVFVAHEIEKQEIKEVKEMIDVNLIGTFNLVKAALPGMKNRTDRKPVSIAFMSSQAGQVGIYGYTAYSASKFGLRGLAEALQQEVIADDIHVSLIFPPDTDTPGFAEENKRKPRLTSIIAASSGAMQADEVAKKALNGIISGSFFVPGLGMEALRSGMHNRNRTWMYTAAANAQESHILNVRPKVLALVFLLSIATVGLSPQRSYLMAFVEVISAGILRIAGLCFQWTWYGSIEKWHAQQKS
nr:3-dehydrosphinganine reductase TSC10A-like [Tanacetum cinerariifolium]